MAKSYSINSSQIRNIVFVVLVLLGGFLAILISQLVRDSQHSSQGIGSQAFVPLAGIDSLRSVFPYNLSIPAKKITLPEALTEISGLGLVSGGVLAAIQDEKAHLYQFDPVEESLLSKCDFGKSNDYEGVEVIGNTVYVTESNGDLHVFPICGEEDVEATQYKTPLTHDNDVEGLGYYPPEDLLLMACKGSPNIDKKLYSGFRAIYAFNLKTNRLNPAPFLLINKREVAQVLKAQAQTPFEREAAAEFDPTDKDAFRPSGIAIHPQSQDIYIVGTVGKLLLVYRKDGKLQAAIPLNEKVFKQPEGIAISSDGLLYISNEGRNKKGNILIFTPK